MERLKDVVESLNKEFSVESFGKDPAFSRFIPEVYQHEPDWKSFFEPMFTQFYNGLMIKGEATIRNVFLAVFPTTHVLEKFIHKSEPGDLLFMHHPLVMECGDPLGKWGRGFVPIEHHFLHQIAEKGLSIYTCHAPLDYHPTLSTSLAIAEQLGLENREGFIHDDKHGNLGIIGNCQSTNTELLIAKLKAIFNTPYVDFEGCHQSDIKKIAVVAGCGDKVKWMKEVEERGVDAYVTGEIHCHIDNEYGRMRYQEMKNYVKTTSMSLIGVSHSASEYLVKETLMSEWFRSHFDVNLVMIPQEKWWL
ncbi:Nif3-like dinuclear metal center hexameric protein [Bacillus spongiae]|uniref:GTP cyclohydrolase 1 type 2 homolog n=1 Tax=Bacillus spongiae TaxID=2683610 RepID=A0ABU8HCH0_9BACI